MSFQLNDAAMMLGVLIFMVTMLWTVGRLTKIFGISAEVKRKIVHVVTGLTSLSFPWLFSNPLPVIIMIAISLLTMAALRTSLISRYSISQVLHDVQRQSYGEFYLLLAVGFLFMVSTGNPILYVLPLTVIALSDTASALIGTKYGKRRFAVAGGEKSLEGAVAFFIVTLVACLVLLILLTDIADWNIIILSVMIAAFCTLVESDSWKGLDNIFVPVGAYMILAYFMNDAPIELVKSLAIMTAVIVITHKVAPMFNLTKHGGRAYALLIILIFIGTYNNHVLFPLLAILTHLFARKSHPSQDPNRDLEMIAVTAAVGMLWLFSEYIVADSAIDLFNLSFASVSVIFIGLALGQKWRLITFPAAVLIGILYLWHTTLTKNPTVSLDIPYILPACSLGLAAACVMFKPRFFSTFRSLRAYAVALVVPVLSFILIGLLSWV